MSNISDVISLNQINLDTWFKFIYLITWFKSGLFKIHDLNWVYFNAIFKSNLFRYLNNQMYFLSGFKSGLFKNYLISIEFKSSEVE